MVHAVMMVVPTLEWMPRHGLWKSVELDLLFVGGRKQSWILHHFKGYLLYSGISTIIPSRNLWPSQKDCL